MRISLLEIENFRGISRGKVQFENHTVLIGPNNSGKTTIIEALALVFGRDGMVRNLTEHDFHGSDPVAATRVNIIATITGFEPEEFSAHPDWFRDGRGVPFWYDPETGDVLPAKTKPHQQLACQIIFSARFVGETLEVETARTFNDGTGVDVFDEDSYVTFPRKLVRETGFFMIPASRSWDRMLSFSSELFRRVIRSAGGLPAETILNERNKLRAPENVLEADQRLGPIINEVNQEIAGLFGRPSSLRLRLTTTDSAGVLDAVVPHFQNTGGTNVPSKREGSGLVSLQSLFLLLHFGQKRVDEGESFCMALEEPELHLPPSVQRRVLSRLQTLSTQTIVSTHSPLIASFCPPESLLIVRNIGGTLTASPILAQPLGQEATNAVRKLFQINRVETASAVMNEFVLVPEGRYDYDWLMLLLRVAELGSEGDQVCHFGVRVGVIPTADAKVKETCAILSKAHPAIVALVDGDADGHGYAAALDQGERTAGKVLLWPEGWTIEDLVGWVAAADETEVMARLDTLLEPPAGTLGNLIARLKSNDRAQGGLKGDGVAYEIIANILCERPPCRARARVALHAIAQACAGERTAHFALQERDAALIPRLVFQP